jgi:nucleotide-binding universal stress UspA family protein
LEAAWDRALKRAQEALSQTARLLTHVKVVQEVLQHPKPADAILQYAKAHHADMIVIGRRGHSRLGTIIGSVSFAVVQQSPIPVTVVGAFPIWDVSVADGRGKELT